MYGPSAHFLFLKGAFMRQVPRNLQSLIEPVVTALGYELVGIELLPGGRGSLLRLYIDHENGITLADCERVSHQVSGLLDVEDPVQGQYTLEVSSPGLDRPMFTLEHFNRFVGRLANVQLNTMLNGRRRYKGIIKSVDGEKIILIVGDEELSLTLDMIEKAKLVPEF